MAYPFDPCVDLNFMRNAYVGSNGSLHVTGRGSRVLTHTRAGSAWYFDKDGVLQAAAANVPRLDWDPTTLQLRGLLLEEARTNSLRNNSATGAVVGTPGTLPTNWTQNNSTGIVARVAAFGTDNGIPYVDIQIVGTTAVGQTNNIIMEVSTQIAALNAQVWTGSFYTKIAAGSLSNISSLILQVQALDVGGANLGTFPLTFTPTTAALSSQRIVNTATLNNASTAFIRQYIGITAAVAPVAVDLTLRIGAPQLELGAFVTSPILTTAAAVTRAVANMTAPLPASFRQNYMTIATEEMQPSINSQTNVFGVVDDGSSNNRMTHYNNASNGTTIQTVTVGGGTIVGNTASVTLTANAPYRKSASYQADRQACILAVGGVLTAVRVTASPMPVGINTLRLGTVFGGTFPMTGWLRRIRIWPRVIPDGGLAMLVR